MLSPLHRSAVATLMLSFGSAATAQTLIYSDSSSQDKLHSKVGVAVEEEGFALQADMTMVGLEGQTRVLPRITSSWTSLEFLDVETVFVYDDWNGTSLPSRPTMDTSVLYQSSLPFIDRIEGSIRRSGTSSNETLQVELSRLETGLALFGGDALGITADMTMKNSGGSQQALSSITSSFGVGTSLDVKSVLRLEDAGTSPFSSPALDTKLVYAPGVAFIDKLEGGVHRSASGVTRQSLAVLFPDISSGDQYGTSFKVTNKAVLEEMLRDDGLETLSMGVETKLTGFMPPLLGGSNALSFRVERQLDAEESQTSSLAYDHSWSPGGASIGLNFKMLRDPEDVEPSMGITWMTEF